MGASRNSSIIETSQSARSTTVMFGRLGRLLVVLQLIEAGALKYPLLNIAEWLEPRRQEYQDRLLQLSIDGDFDPWVSFFCTGICNKLKLPSGLSIAYSPSGRVSLNAYLPQEAAEAPVIGSQTSSSVSQSWTFRGSSSGMTSPTKAREMHWSGSLPSASCAKSVGRVGHADSSFATNSSPNWIGSNRRAQAWVTCSVEVAGIEPASSSDLLGLLRA
jgi:hypothetical protein